ncbi:MAG: DUF4013 domain-containing protein [archaeon]
MDLTENLNNSFEYAKKLFSDFGRLILLIILNAIPLVNWIVTGYACRVLRESPESREPPRLENYGDLFVEGAKVLIVSVIYMIVPLILILSGAGSFMAAMMGGGPDFMRDMRPTGAILFSGVGLTLVLIGALLAFAILIILAVAIAHMIRTGQFGKAFAFHEVLNIIQKIGWGKYLGWVVLAAVVSVAVGMLTGSIPAVGWLIHAIISPALTVFFFRSLALLYSDGTR